MGIKIRILRIAVGEEEAVGVGDTYGIDMVMTKEEHDVDNGGEDAMEIRIHLPNVGSVINMNLPQLSRGSDDVFGIGDRQEVVGVGDSYRIGITMTKEELNTNNVAKGAVEIGIRFSDVAGAVEIGIRFSDVAGTIEMWTAARGG